MIDIEKQDLTILWSDSLSVGIPKIDEQHKRLIEFYNKLIQVPKESGTVVEQAIGMLENYAKFHFLEERAILMSKEFSPHYVEFHEEEHGLFLKQLIAFKKDSLLGLLPLEKICDFIKLWVTLHVTKVDSKLKDGKEKDTLVGPMMANYLRNKV
jgi:hemerythrin